MAETCVGVSGLRRVPILNSVNGATFPACINAYKGQEEAGVSFSITLHADLRSNLDRGLGRGKNAAGTLTEKLEKNGTQI